MTESERLTTCRRSVSGRERDISGTGSVGGLRLGSSGCMVECIVKTYTHIIGLMSAFRTTTPMSYTCCAY